MTDLPAAVPPGKARHLIPFDDYRTAIEARDYIDLWITTTATSAESISRALTELDNWLDQMRGLVNDFNDENNLLYGSEFMEQLDAAYGDIQAVSSRIRTQYTLRHSLIFGSQNTSS
jgi:hypothetical protein